MSALDSVSSNGQSKRKRQCSWQSDETTLAGMSQRGEGEGASRQVPTELRGTIKKSLCPLPPSLSSGRGISLTLHRVSLDDFDKETTTTTQRDAQQQGQARPKNMEARFAHRDTQLIHPHPPLVLINVVRGQGRSTPSRPHLVVGGSRDTGYNVIRPRLYAVKNKTTSLQVCDCQQ